MKRIKVVLPKDVAYAEKLAIKDGYSSEAFMEKAAKKIKKNIQEISSNKKIVAFIGKGNNAGDVLLTCFFLLEEGYKINIYSFFKMDDFSPLALKMYRKFLQIGGEVEFLKSGDKIKKNFKKDEIILDGIFGIGFKGKISEKISKVIKKVNNSPALKIAIDIPSGLNGETGKVFNKNCFKADYTFYMGLPKLGFFIENGYEYIGKLLKIDFGLGKQYLDKITPQLYLIESVDKKDFPQILKIRDKYKAGFVTGIAGTNGMEGAANLSGKAALRSGAGIVKIFTNASMKKITDEIISLNIDEDIKKILQVINSSSACFIGPGIGRGKEIKYLLKKLIKDIRIPLVLDADALFFLSKNLNYIKNLPKKIIFTPHKNEMRRLLKERRNIEDLHLINESQKFIAHAGGILILKGHINYIFSKKEKIPLIILGGDPGMATAGSGDVLTGIVTALLSEKLSIKKAAILGLFLHKTAGDFAAKEKTSFSMIASDIIENIPGAIKKM